MSFPKSFQPIDESTPQFPPSFQPHKEMTKKEALEKYAIPGEEFIPKAASGAVRGAASAIPTTLEGLQSLLDLLPGDEKGNQLRRAITNVLLPISKGPTIEESRKLEDSLLGAPTTGAGRIGRNIGEFAGQEIGLGGVNPVGVAAAAAGGGLGQSVRELGLPEELAAVTELTTPTAARVGGNLLSPVKQGAMRDLLSKAKQALYDKYKAIGLSDEHITPLLQSEKKVERLGPFAKKTKAAKEALFETEAGIGGIYSPLKNEAASHGNLNQDQLKIFHGRLSKNLQDLEKTVEPSDEKSKAIKYLRNAIEGSEGKIINPKGEKISFKFRTPEEIVNFYQDINNQGLYGNLSPVKDTIRKTLSEIDPKLAQTFDTTNEAFSKIKKLQKAMGVGDYEKIVSLGESAALLGGLAYGATTGEWGKAGAVLGLGLGRKVATKLLVDPRYQGLSRNIIKAAKSGSKQVVNVAYKQLKEKVKEDFPDDYQDIEWPES